MPLAGDDDPTILEQCLDTQRPGRGFRLEGADKKINLTRQDIRLGPMQQGLGELEEGAREFRPEIPYHSRIDSDYGNPRHRNQNLPSDLALTLGQPTFILAP